MTKRVVIPGVEIWRLGGVPRVPGGIRGVVKEAVPGGGSASAPRRRGCLMGTGAGPLGGECCSAGRGGEGWRGVARGGVAGSCCGGGVCEGVGEDWDIDNLGCARGGGLEGLLEGLVKGSGGVGGVSGGVRGGVRRLARGSDEVGGGGGVGGGSGHLRLRWEGGLVGVGCGGVGGQGGDGGNGREDGGGPRGSERARKVHPVVECSRQ